MAAGTIGGGAVEAEAERRAPSVLAGGQAEVFDFTLQGESAREEGPICGGTTGLAWAGCGSPTLAT